MTTMRTWILLGVLLAILPACNAHLSAPSGFAVVPTRGAIEYKAVSSQGMVIAISQYDNAEEGGDLEFWTGAIEYQKTTIDNLTIFEREDINAVNEDTPGKLFHFIVGEKPRQLLYLVAVFPTDDDVYIVEAVGDLNTMNEKIDNLRSAIESIEF